MARGLVSFVGGQTIDSDQIIADLKARLPAYMVPSRLIALEHMPLNASGKVDRRALLQLLDQESVSYTHLDVYKRQIIQSATKISDQIILP